MEFGHVYESLDTVDFTLPPDGAFTAQALNKDTKAGALNIYIGAPKWGQKSWKGLIYPKSAPDGELLRFYSQNFNAVEFGPTFYLIYSEEEIRRWNTQVTDSPGFKFCPKFPQTITHMRRLKNVEEPTAKFYDSLKGFKNNLGILLMQLGENFSPKSFPEMKSYLESLDKSIKVHVEVRNKNWFSDPAHRTALFSLLRDLNIGTIISDTSGRRDAVHMELTTKDACIRFVGNNLDSTDYMRMDDWVKRIKIWADSGLENLWFFMHQNDERFVPEACTYLVKQINEILGTSIALPTIISLTN